MQNRGSARAPTIILRGIHAGKMEATQGRLSWGPARRLRHRTEAEHEKNSKEIAPT